MITAADFTTVSSPSALTATLLWQLRFPLVFCCGLFLGQARFPPRQLARQMSFRVPVLFVKVIRKPGCDGIDQILLVFALHDGEPTRITKRAPVPAQNSVAHGVERPAPKSRWHRPATNSPRDPSISRAALFVKGEQQDVARIDPVLEQVRHGYVSVGVLPEPAPAMTKSGPGAAVTAASCCSFSSVA
jgi:hypothetical protein